MGDHETQNTIQGEQLGPFYLPAYGAFGLLGLLRDGEFLGPGNLMENGPYLPETHHPDLGHAIEILTICHGDLGVVDFMPSWNSG